MVKLSIRRGNYQKKNEGKNKYVSRSYSGKYYAEIYSDNTHAIDIELSYKNGEFLRYWTIAESASKLNGFGISAILNGVKCIFIKKAKNMKYGWFVLWVNTIHDQYYLCIDVLIKEYMFPYQLISWSKYELAI